MYVKVNYRDGARFEVEAGKHRIICDQPVDNGGKDQGMTPPELLLSSLGTCAGYYAYRYLSTRKLPTAGLAVFVTAEKDTSPARLSRFRVEVETAPLSDKHRDGLLRAVQSCLIHNTLLHAPEIAVDHITILAEIPRCA